MSVEEILTDNSRALGLAQLLRGNFGCRINRGLRRGRHDGLSSHFHRVGRGRRRGKCLMMGRSCSALRRGSVDIAPPPQTSSISGRRDGNPAHTQTDRSPPQHRRRLTRYKLCDTMTTTRRRPAAIIASSLLFTSGLSPVQGFCCGGGALFDSNARPRCRGGTASAERRATQQQV